MNPVPVAIRLRKIVEVKDGYLFENRTRVKSELENGPAIVLGGPCPKGTEEHCEARHDRKRAANARASLYRPKNKSSRRAKPVWRRE